MRSDAPPPPSPFTAARKLGSFRFMELFADGRYVYAVQIHRGGVVLSGYAPGLPLPDVEELLLFREYPELVALVRL